MEWQKEVEVVRSESQKPWWTKPKQKGLEKPIPWPKMPEDDADIDEDDND